jgi:hypothetical protein
MSISLSLARLGDALGSNGRHRIGCVCISLEYAHGYAFSVDLFSKGNSLA